MTLQEKNNLKVGDRVWINLSNYPESVQKHSTVPIIRRMIYNVDSDEFELLNPQKADPIKRVKINNEFNHSSVFMWFTLYHWKESVFIKVHISNIHKQKPKI